MSIKEENNRPSEQQSNSAILLLLFTKPDKHFRLISVLVVYSASFSPIKPGILLLLFKIAINLITKRE